MSILSWLFNAPNVLSLENKIINCIYSISLIPEAFEQYFLAIWCLIITAMFIMRNIFMFPKWQNPYFQDYSDLGVRN